MQGYNNDSSYIGYKGEGILPNIKGSIRGEVNFIHIEDSNDSAIYSGEMYDYEMQPLHGSTYNQYRRLSFDASRHNNIYSDTAKGVIPRYIIMFHYIKF